MEIMSVAAWIITFSLMLFHQGSAEVLEPDCGVPSSPINGVTLSQSPWMAIIKSDQKLCTGVLIHQQYVITAARCLINSTKTIVRLGEFDKTQQNENVTNFQHEEYTVKAAIVHKLFDENYSSYDIALLKLQQKVTYKPHIRPICILLNRARKSEIDRIENFGATLWGLNEIRPYLSPKRSDITRLKSNECYAKIQVTPESSQICAALDDGASCIELGSPLFKFIKFRGTPRTTLYGIQSFGASRTCVYTDIMSYVDWIVGNVLQVKLTSLATPITTEDVV